MSLGLAWLRKLVAADTYDERYQLLAPQTGEQDPDFMFKVLYDMDVIGSDKDLIMIHELTEDDFDHYIEPPLTEDLDKGPLIAWRWAHNRFSAAYTYGLRPLAHMRKSGYVMFDHDRLQDRYDLETSFNPVMFPPPAYCEIYTRARKKMEYTIRKRSEIYDSGGRGYWNEESGSKIIWQVSRPEDMAELTLGGESYRDFWEQGILVDRVRHDDYMVYDL